MVWTDCDREGENIGKEIADVCTAVNSRIQIHRARFSSLDPYEIRRAAQNLTVLDERLSDAVAARSELDLRIGACFTRLQTVRIQSKFSLKDVISYGSCQFPTLGFVVEQYFRRKNFRAEDFWSITATLTKEGISATFNWKKGKLFDKFICAIFYEICITSPMATITFVENRPKSMWKPLPLRTVEFQKFGSNYLKISSDKLMKIAESLYNKGFISYPRTETDEFDSKFDFMSLIEKQTQDPNWGEFAARLKNGEFSIPRRGKNNDKAHPPIHPIKIGTELQGDDRKVYEFVTRRFLACCSKNAEGELTEVKIDICNEEFQASGSVLIRSNYLDVYIYDKWSNSLMPKFIVGEKLNPASILMTTGTTTAPKLLSESDLISTMDKNQIGTDATIHEHIKKIIDRKYVTKNSEKRFEPTSMGISLVEAYNRIGFDVSLTKPFLRAKMEKEMADIAEGRKTKAAVVRDNLRMYREVFVKIQEHIEFIDQAISTNCEYTPRAQRHAEARPPITRPDSIVTQEIPNCLCGLVAVLRVVSKIGETHGKEFYCCPKGFQDKCGFFQWSSPDMNASGGNNRTTVNDSSKSQRFRENRRNTINSQNCDCGQPSTRLTARTGKNQGRVFFKCSKKEDQCKYFYWEDGKGNLSENTPKCFNCNEYGHFSTSCSKRRNY